MMNPAPRHRGPSRRRFIRGLGVGLALPPLAAFSQDRSSPPKETHGRGKMLLISNNLGVLPESFFPSQTGPQYQASPYLEELQLFREDLTVFSGLSHPAVAGGHSTENCFLTAAKDPTGSGFRNTISLDQFAASRLPQSTRFPTLNLGVNIDKANRSLSWTRDGILLPAEDRPSKLFEKLFVQGSVEAVDRQLHRLRQRGSILDAVAQDLRRFRTQLPREDQTRLDQYATSIRELEIRLQISGEWETKPKPVPQKEPPVDITDRSKFFDKFEQMLAMAVLALETHSTRIVTLMVDAFATPVFEIDTELRSLQGYHNLSHHGQVAEKVDQLRQVDLRQMRLLRTLLADLAARSDGNARLLDQVMVLYGSNMGDSNTHENTNLPILLAGGGFQHGRHVAFDRQHNTPLANLFVSMLQQLGLDTGQFASSTGSLSGLDPLS